MGAGLFSRAWRFGRRERGRVGEYEVPLVGKEHKGGHGPEGFGNAVFSAVQLANGNTLIGNCHAQLDTRQFIEMTPKTKVVWTVRDFTNFGNSMPVRAVLVAK